MHKVSGVALQLYETTSERFTRFNLELLRLTELKNSLGSLHRVNDLNPIFNLIDVMLKLISQISA